MQELFCDASSVDSVLPMTGQTVQNGWSKGGAMELTLPRARRHELGEALVCAADPRLRMRLCSSVLWLTSWSTVSVSTAGEALAAFGRRPFAALFVELRHSFVSVLAPALSWDHWAEGARPFVIGVACGVGLHGSALAEPEGDACPVPSGWLDARLGHNYGPRAFGQLFAERDAEPAVVPAPALRVVREALFRSER
jgi:hypothetical protein